MAGYDGFSKSHNARTAEANGLWPISILAKKFDVDIDFIRANFSPSEWHHTSKHYNKTNYYDLEEVEEFLTTDEGKNALVAFRKNQKEKKLSRVFNNCVVHWLEWEEGRGYRGRKVRYPSENKAEGATVVVKGKSAYIEFRSGRKMTKRLGTNGFLVFPEGAISPL